jgi:hypothetical protein
MGGEVNESEAFRVVDPVSYGHFRCGLAKSVRNEKAQLTRENPEVNGLVTGLERT